MQQLAIDWLLLTICTGAAITAIAAVLCAFILSGRLSEQERKQGME